MEKVLLLLGTRKGAFILQSDRHRKTWDVRGPFCETWPIHHFVADEANGALHAAGGNEWFGPAIWTSRDLGKTWTHSSRGLAYEAGEQPIKAAWSLTAGHGMLYAGVEPAGLFRSEDGGETWNQVRGLREHPSRASWTPGGGGLILHTLVLHPDDPRQIWAGISAGGVFHSADGGTTWAARNKGTRADFMPEDQRYPDHGQCVHCMVMAAGLPDRLYQQNHCGMYRSDDGGQRWHSIEAGLPSSFGFPAAAHPRDPETLYLMPLNGDIAGRFPPQAKAAVWRTRDGGRTWADLRAGLPQENAYFGVLRQAMATDRLDPAGVYVGTSSGTLYASADEGETWDCIAQHLPVISSVETFVVQAT